MRRLLAIACALGIAALAGAVLADGSALKATITSVIVRVDGKFLITTSTVIDNQPKCASMHNILSGDVSTPGGKAAQETALAAFVHKKAVRLRGAGKCKEYPGDATKSPPVAGYESLQEIQIE